jgi:hypothetical protein
MLGGTLLAVHGLFSVLQSQGEVADPALLHNWATGRLIRPTLLLTSAWGVTKDRDLGFVCEEGVFYHWKPPSILSSCYAQYYSLWGSFMLMISIILRKSKSLGIEVMFSCFFFYVVENGVSDGAG